MYQDLRIDRILLTIGLVLYAGWGFIYNITSYQAKDPIELRIIGIYLISFILLLSYSTNYVKKYLTYFIYFICYVVTVQQSYLVAINQYSSEFLILYIVLIITLNAYFKRPYHLAFYVLFSILVIYLSTFLNTGEPKVDFVLFISSVISISCLIFPIFSSRLKMQEKLAYNESLMKTIFNKSADALFLICPSTHKIIECNDRALEIFSAKEKVELTGIDLEELFKTSKNGIQLSLVEESLKFDNYWNKQLEGKTITGKSFWGDVAINLVKTEKNRIWLMRVADVTERKKAEQQLELKTLQLINVNAELEKFAYVASHDLQEPLRMVTSYVQLLQKRYHYKLDKDAHDFINYAVEGALRMQALINDLLTYGRLAYQKRPKETVDISVILGIVIKSLEKSIEKNDTKITHDPLPTIIANKTEMIQLFQNLLGNAIKFHGTQTPKIHVSALEYPTYWMFSVRDNGIGIAKNYYDKIFTIFQRLHKRNDYPGTGIGLAICKKIVEQYGGKIWVESNEGEGSAFFFTINKRL